MRVTELKLVGVKVLEPAYFEDYRGYFTESYSERTLGEIGINDVFVQDNHSFTHKDGALRGIHFQNNPHPQTKLVRCIRGTIMDVAVDLRKNSPTFRQWVSVILSGENRKQLYIPHGFGHAFLTLTDNCEVQYKVDTFYDPQCDRTIIWNDPDINIKWPIGASPVVSEKDGAAPFLRDCDVNFI